jgi:hypothetical protein
MCCLCVCLCVYVRLFGLCVVLHTSGVRRAREARDLRFSRHVPPARCAAQPRLGKEAGGRAAGDLLAEEEQEHADGRL